MGDRRPDYAFLAEVLGTAGARVEPAEAHGTLCGLSLAGATARERWLADVLGPADSQIGAEAREYLLDLAEQAAAALERGDPEFGPLLPADEAPLAERAAALADWCGGFVYAVAVAHGSTDWTDAPAPVHEALADLVEITKAGVEADPSEPDEQAYAELVEYVRVAAQLVFEFWCPPAG